METRPLLLIIRHAESVANVEHRLASRLEVPLSVAGFDQAERVAERLLELHTPTKILSSPLLRARQTAQAFAGPTGLEPAIREELTEQHLGRFSGMTYDEVSREPDYRHDRTDRWKWIPDGGGESYEMIAARVGRFFTWLNTASWNDFTLGGNSKPSVHTILIVTHAVTMRMIRAHLEGTLPRYPEGIAANGEVWRLNYQGFGCTHTIESLFLDNTDTPRHGE